MSTMFHYETNSSDTITDIELANIAEFVAEAEKSQEPAATNMGWNEPAGLLYNIKNQLRWKTNQGKIVLVLDHDKPVAISCVEYPEHDYTWAIGGIRTWITPQYRARKVAKVFLNVHYNWARSRGCKFLVITFNDYNRSAWHAVKNPKYRSTANWSDWWDNCVAVDQPLIIRHVPQWCIIKPVLSNSNDKNIEDILAWAAKINTL